MSEMGEECFLEFHHLTCSNLECSTYSTETLTQVRESELNSSSRIQIEIFTSARYLDN